jgi:HEAT repeat protein
MISGNYDQNLQVVESPLTLNLRQVQIKPQPEQQFLAELSPDQSWGIRKNAAKSLGYMHSQEALDGLLSALPRDPFWMVRCEIIQALERIGDPKAVPTLTATARDDSFQVVRSYAVTAIKRLSQEN